MAFSRGDMITATGMNNVGSSITRTYAEGHAGWTYTSRNYYFFSLKHAGQNHVEYYSKRTAGCNHSVTIYRWEDGSWVQKDYQRASGGLPRWYTSKGMGSYRVYLYYHNNTPTTVLYPGKTDNVRGKLLAMVSDNLVNHTDASVKAINPRYHGLITASALNNGRVYTI